MEGLSGIDDDSDFGVVQIREEILWARECKVEIGSFLSSSNLEITWEITPLCVCVC